MRIVIIDNYDSFTYNLSHLVKETGIEVVVIRNENPLFCKAVAISNANIKKYAGRKPILGVCLGHQAIGEVFGGQLENLAEVFHGVASPCHIISDDPIFHSMEKDITVGRYHSWVVSKTGLPSCCKNCSTTSS